MKRKTRKSLQRQINLTHCNKTVPQKANKKLQRNSNLPQKQLFRRGGWLHALKFATFHVKTPFVTACKKPFQNKEKHDCNAIQTYRKSNFPPWSLVTGIAVRNYTRKNATAPLVKNRFKIKKNTTVTQFRPSVKATFPPWGFVADALKRCVAKKSAKCPCKQRHLFFCVAISDCVKGFVWRSP